MKKLCRLGVVIALVAMASLAPKTIKGRTVEPCDEACDPTPIVLQSCQKAGGKFICCRCVFKH